jgi:cytochrome c biogenesis protein CcmG/thiol:disulfide interchange protein DsbE
VSGPRAAALAALLLTGLVAGCGADEPDGGGTAAGPTDVASVETDLPPCPDQPGRPAAEQDLAGVRLTCFSGGTLDLGRAPGVPTVINLWASWCGPCADELPDYQAFSQKYAGKVDVLGVDWQDARLDKAKALIRRTGVTYPLVTDPDGTLRNKYLPKLILIDEDGNVAYQKYVKITSVTQLESLVEKHLKVPTV